MCVQFVCVCVRTAVSLVHGIIFVYFHHFPNFALLSLLNEGSKGRQRAAELIASE